MNAAWQPVDKRYRAGLGPRFGFSRWGRTAGGLVITALLLSPLYWVLAGSFMLPRELFSPTFHLWPREFALQNWTTALARLAPHLKNSLSPSRAPAGRNIWKAWLTASAEPVLTDFLSVSRLAILSLFQ